MSMTDPIADFISRIRNGFRARHEVVNSPRSKVRLRIAEILKDEGYLESVTSVDDSNQGVISCTLRYDNSNTGAVTGIRRISRPGQRTYVKAADVPKALNGLGIVIVSTSNGVMTDGQARKQGVGGELLCEVW